jgi:hypothetical protein
LAIGLLFIPFFFAYNRWPGGDIAFSWILLSAMLSITLIIIAPRALPVGARLAKGIVLDTELQLLEELLKHESITKTLLQNKYDVLRRNIKPSVIRTQIEGIPFVIIFGH